MISTTQILSIAVSAMLAGMIGTASANQMGSGGTGWQTAPGMMNNHDMGPGTMGADPMGGYCPACGARMESGHFFGLNLSQDQRDQIANIETQAREQQWNLMGQMREAQYKLNDMLSAQNADPTRINDQAVTVEKLEQQMVQANTNARDKVLSLLTPEQRDRVIHWNEAVVTPDY